MKKEILNGLINSIKVNSLSYRELKQVKTLLEAPEGAYLLHMSALRAINLRLRQLGDGASKNEVERVNIPTSKGYHRNMNKPADRGKGDG